MIHKYKGITPEIHNSCYIAPGGYVIGKVTIGRDSSVWHNAVVRGDMASIIIGEESNIQDGCVLHCVNDIDTVVGDRVTVGHGAILHSCTVEDGCLIGMGAIILDRVKIGKNSLVAAGSVVTPNTVVPEGSMVMGSPAKVKRELTPEEIIGMQKGYKEYLRLSGEYNSEN